MKRLAALVLLALPASAADPRVDIPVDCGQAVCVLPKDILMALLKAHNEQVDEIALLRGQLRGKARICPGEKES